MKKVFLIAAFVGTSVAVQAKMLAFGVKAGINTPYFKADFKPESKTNLGFHAGVFGQVNIPIIGLGIQPELLYLNQPVSFLTPTTEEGIGIKNDTKSASYLDIPINITWGIDVKIVRPFVALTPYLRYSFSNIKTLALPENPTTAQAQQKLNDFDYGIGVGAGIDLLSKLQLMGRYSWGLSNLVNSGDYKVRSFTLSLGYIF
jgi:hypothetical protein